MYTLDNTECYMWFERDRASVELRDPATNRTIFELWDGDVYAFIEGGFKGRDSWHHALVKYANEHRLAIPAEVQS